jgi:hypothetical protein
VRGLKNAVALAENDNDEDGDEHGGRDKQPLNHRKTPNVLGRFDGKAAQRVKE